MTDWEILIRTDGENYGVHITKDTCDFLMIGKVKWPLWNSPEEIYKGKRQKSLKDCFKEIRKILRSGVINE